MMVGLPKNVVEIKLDKINIVVFDGNHSTFL